MGKGIIRRPSPAMAVALLALMVALGGTGYAASTISGRDIKNGSIRSADLGRGQVKRADIAKRAVTSAKVRNGTLKGKDFKAGQLPAGPQGPKGDPGPPGPSTGPAGGDLSGNYPNPLIGNAKVNSAKIQDGQIRAGDLGSIVTVSNTVGIAGNSNASAVRACPAGTRLIAGGAQPATFGVELTSTLRSGTNTWIAQARNNNAGASTLTVFAYCLAG